MKFKALIEVRLLEVKDGYKGTNKKVLKCLQGGEMFNITAKDDVLELVKGLKVEEVYSFDVLVAKYYFKEENKTVFSVQLVDVI